MKKIIVAFAVLFLIVSCGNSIRVIEYNPAEISEKSDGDVGEAQKGDSDASIDDGSYAENGDSDQNGADSGDSGSDSGSTGGDSDSGDSTADSGNSGGDSGDSGSDSGDSGADSGDSGDSDSGDSGSGDSGDSGSDSGDSGGVSPVPPAGDCANIMVCMKNCPENNQSCINSCYSNGTNEGKNQYDALFACDNENSCGGVYSCWWEKCRDEAALCGFGEAPASCSKIFDGNNCSESACASTEDCCGADICADTAVCGHSVCRNALFKEDFESYEANSFPESVWTLQYDGKGEENQIVTTKKFVSGSKSMRLLGEKNWSATMFAVFPEIPETINVEMQMNPQTNDVFFSLCSMEGANFSNYWGTHLLKVEFQNDKILYEIPEYSAYPVADVYVPDQWYKVRLKFDQGNQKISIWIDDMPLVKDASFSLEDSYSIPHLCLTGGNLKGGAEIYFDDIFMWAE